MQDKTYNAGSSKSYSSHPSQATELSKTNTTIPHRNLLHFFLFPPSYISGHGNLANVAETSPSITCSQPCVNTHTHTHKVVTSSL